MGCSCEIETNIDNDIFSFKTEDETKESDFDSDVASSTNPEVVEQRDSVASFVAQHRYTITVHDIRRPDSRFPNGSICAKVKHIHNFN